MAERIVPVVQVRVHMDCEEEGCNGEMVSNGDAFLTYPPRYPHVCNVCKAVKTFNVRYPSLDFREVPNE